MLQHNTSFRQTKVLSGQGDHPHTSPDHDSRSKLLLYHDYAYINRTKIIHTIVAGLVITSSASTSTRYSILDITRHSIPRPDIAERPPFQLIQQKTACTSGLCLPRFTMHFASLLAVAPALVVATLDPCSSNTKGACPSSLSCSAAKVSTAIQAAECSHNTRVSGTQTFAVFTTDHQYDSNHGAPYGTCKAYTCTPPTTSQMTNNTDCWTFFWR